jgi:hypothetical protein
MLCTADRKVRGSSNIDSRWKEWTVTAEALPVGLEVVVGGVGVDNPMGMTWKRLLRGFCLK